MNCSSRQRGKAFEDMFERLLLYQGFLPLKNRLSVKVIGPNKFLPEKSQLDYTVISRKGDVGFFDCKSFVTNSIPFSHITKHQLEKALLYNEWAVCSGFIIWFRSMNLIVFFSGLVVNSLAGKSLGPDNGIVLGPLENFQFKRVFDSEIPKLIDSTHSQ